MTQAPQNKGPQRQLEKLWCNEGYRRWWGENILLPELSIQKVERKKEIKVGEKKMICVWRKWGGGVSG